MPSVQFATCAVSKAPWVPSIALSFTTAIRKLTEVCPAGMTTAAGTCTAVVSLEVKVTVTALPGAAFTVTVPCTVPAPSVVVAGALSERGGSFVVLHGNDSRHAGEARCGGGNDHILCSIKDAVIHDGHVERGAN